MLLSLLLLLLLFLLLLFVKPPRVSLLYELFSYINLSYLLIGQLGRVFANGPGDLGSIPGRTIPKTLKIVLNTSLLNTQQYKVRIKGKVEQSKERSSALPDTLKRKPSGHPRLRSPTLQLLHVNLKKKKRKNKAGFLYKTCILLIQYLYKDQILFSNLFDSYEKCPFRFFVFWGFFYNYF